MISFLSITVLLYCFSLSKNFNLLPFGFCPQDLKRVSNWCLTSPLCFSLSWENGGNLESEARGSGHASITLFNASKFPKR